MTSDEPVGHDNPDPGQVDPDFEGLFRPEDLAAPSAATPAPEPVPESTHEPVHEPVHEATPEPTHEPTPEQAVLPKPAPTSPGSDTGRLFRSQGVQGHAEAVLALDPGRFTRLRTLERTTEPIASPTSASEPLDDDPAPDAEVAALLGVEAVPVLEGDSVATSPRRSSRQRNSRSASRGPVGRGISAGAVSIVTIGVTLVVGLANALLGDGTLTWPTGLALLASSVYAALTVRRDADTIAFLMPPVAFLIAALTAGQFFLDSSEGSLINRAAVAFFTLGENWIWIIGTTLIALVIVLVRRRRD